MRFRKSTTVLLTAAVVLAAGAGTASAVIEKQQYNGMPVYDDDNGKYKVGEIAATSSYNVIKNYINEPGYSDEIRAYVYFRDTYSANANGVHTTVDWQKHSRYCYITGIDLSVSKDGAGVGGQRACETGWNGDGATESADYSDTAWHYVYHPKGYTPTKLSFIGGLHICQRESDADPCSGYRLFAADIKL